MKFPKSEKDFEELMKGIKWNRIIPPLVSVLQPVIIFGLWLGFSKIDKRADAVSKLIAIAEPIPAIDLNLPRPVVLASLYHSVDEALDVLNDVIDFMKDLDIPSADEIIDKVKDEVKEVKNGYECGVMIENYADIKVGDIIETFEEIKTNRKL